MWLGQSRPGAGTTDPIWGWSTCHARATCHNRGKNLTHDILENHERLYSGKAKIACDVLVRGTNNHQRTIAALNILAEDTINIDGEEFEANFLASVRPKLTITSPLGMRSFKGPTNKYVTAKTLEAKKRKDQKRSRAESSWSPPPELSRKRTERAEQAVPRLPNTTLNSTRTEIFLHIREKGLLEARNLIRTRSKEHDRGRYYRFHRDYDHNTEECYNPKNQIEDLIHRGHLNRFVRKPCECSPTPNWWLAKSVEVSRPRANMAPHFTEARHLISMIKYFNISQIPRIKNTRADTLVKSASIDASSGGSSAIASIYRPTVATIEEARRRKYYAT
ncbi:hypothetical protein B296_00037997 [Ensete ventricosum]|uniref:RNase H type-1 domain-containing protein n=1 Tax=Ensete ventricosum TaxID=4639 RepID=A0A426YVP9_ENSVE|nr:hypothetical protein B296_00037997 [Ensete ventricosum]